jgi:hypothetical protein
MLKRSNAILTQKYLGVLKKYFVGKYSLEIFHQVSPASLLDICFRNCRRALLDESGMITTGTHNRSEMVAVRGSSRVPAP